MDPISMITAASAVIGIGMSLFGSNKAAQASAQIAQDSSQIEGLDEQVNAQRKQQMVLESNRQQLQDIRNQQKARSMAESSAVNQGAQLGSGLPGGYGQISGETNTNILGVSQNRQIATNIFGDYDQIDTLKQQIAQLEGSQAGDKGFAAIGSAIAGGSGTIGKIGGQLLGMFPSGSGNFSGGMGLNSGTGGLY
jgi:hypothetical protein